MMTFFIIITSWNIWVFFNLVINFWSIRMAIASYWDNFEDKDRISS